MKCFKFLAVKLYWNQLFCCVNKSILIHICNMFAYDLTWQNFSGAWSLKKMILSTLLNINSVKYHKVKLNIFCIWYLFQWKQSWIFSVTSFFTSHSNMVIWCLIIIINVENSFAASYFCGKCDNYFPEFFDE